MEAFSKEVTFEKLVTTYFGNCYKISTYEYPIIRGKVRQLYFHFNDSISHESLPSLKIFITSEQNSYGIVLKTWLDEKVMKVDIPRNKYKIIHFHSPEQYEYLRSKSKCSDESFYECYGNVLSEKIKECPSICNIYSLPSLPGMKKTET